MHDLQRVKRRIGPTIVEFFLGLRDGEHFHAGTLRDYVANRVGRDVAPNSAYRIMYELKKQGQINYELVSRSNSEYSVVR